MYRPLGRDDGLLVVEPYDAVFLGLTHEVTHGVAFGNVEIEIGLDATVVSVGGHGVPYAAGLEFGQTHLELTGTLFEHIVDNELVDDAVIALLHLASGEAVGLDRAFASVDGDELGLVGLVGCGGVEIEFGGVGSVLAAEGHFLVTAAYIESVLEVELIVLAVDIDNAVATYINYTEFTTLEEVFGLEGVDGLELHDFGHGHHAAVDETVIHGVGEVALVLLHDFGHHEAFAELSGVVMLNVVGMTGAEHCIVGLSHS